MPNVEHSADEYPPLETLYRQQRDYWRREAEAWKARAMDSRNSALREQLQGAVAALRKIAELDDEGGKHVEVCLVAARAIAADELARLGGR